MVQEKKDTLIDFPCDFPIKIIGIVSEEFTSTIVDIIQKHLPKFDAHKIEMKGRAAENISVLPALYM